MLFSENETLAGCDMAIEGLNKKMMREIHYSCDDPIEGLKKKMMHETNNIFVKNKLNNKDKIRGGDERWRETMRNQEELL